VQQRTKRQRTLSNHLHNGFERFHNQLHQCRLSVHPPPSQRGHGRVDCDHEPRFRVSNFVADFVSSSLQRLLGVPNHLRLSVRHCDARWIDQRFRRVQRFCEGSSSDEQA
jgi:hypothetical protein